jgi:MFS transporter
VIQLEVTVVNVAIKQIGSAFAGGVSELQWLISAYTLMFAALILTAGALADRFGARRVFCIGFVIFISASVACGLAPSIAFLIAARAVQGLGAPLLVSCSLALLNHTFHDPARRAQAVGRWAYRDRRARPVRRSTEGRVGSKRFSSDELRHSCVEVSPNPPKASGPRGRHKGGCGSSTAATMACAARRGSPCCLPRPVSKAKRAGAISSA